MEEIEKKFKLFKTLQIVSILVLVVSFIAMIVVIFNIEFSIIANNPSINPDEITELVIGEFSSYYGIIMLLEILVDVGIAGIIVFSILKSKNKKRLRALKNQQQSSYTSYQNPTNY